MSLKRGVLEQSLGDVVASVVALDRPLEVVVRFRAVQLLLDALRSF